MQGTLATKCVLIKVGVMLLLVSAAASSPAGGQTVWYVDDDAPLGGNGTSWPTAFKRLQDAFASADTGDYILVGEGTYKPDQDEGGSVTPGDREAAFQLKNGVIISGGFAGWTAPDSPDLRNLDLYPTTLTGDLEDDDAPNVVDCCGEHRGTGCREATCQAVVCGAHPECCDVAWSEACAFYAGNLCSGLCGGISDNSYHIVSAINNDRTAILDGVTIIAGNANGSGENGSGGGLYLVDAAPLVVNCTFAGNRSAGDVWPDSGGGGVFNRDGSPSFVNCSFYQNRAHFGGGLTTAHGSVELVDCEFVSNLAVGYGGLFNMNGTTTLTRCVFKDNSGEQAGGIGFYGSAAGVLTGCTFFNNNGGSDGGAVYSAGGQGLLIVQSVFAGNTANMGGAIYATSPLTITTSHFLANLGGTGGAIHVYSDLVTIANCEFVGNSGVVGGGLSAGFAASPGLSNCLFVGNIAEIGGAMYIDEGNPIFGNCSVISNRANSAAGGLYIDGGVPVLSNDIFWNNVDPGGADESGQVYNGVVNVHYSCIQGWTGAFGGTGNMGQAPAFVGGASGTWSLDASYSSDAGQTTFVDSTQSWPANGLVGKFLNPDASQFRQGVIVANTDITMTIWGDLALLGEAGNGYQMGDYRLGIGSPCVDAGKNGLVPADTTDLDGDGNTAEVTPLDLDDNPRFVDDPYSPDTGNGTPPIVDMGAYEVQRGASIPAVSPWGLLVAGVLLVGVAGVVLGRRRVNLQGECAAISSRTAEQRMTMSGHAVPRS